MVKPIEFLSGFLILVLIVNLILLALGKIHMLAFFIILIVVGLIAYKGIPYLRNLSEQRK